jgi:DNA repair photolyase
MTVTTLDRSLARILEFRAPTPELRLRAIRTLRDAGVSVGITLSPILPHITDSPANLEAVIAAAREHGANNVFWNVLFLKPTAQQAFFPFLQQHFPHLAKRYSILFARSAFLGGAYKARIGSLIDKLKQKHGFQDEADLATPAPVHEAETEQLPLFQIDLQASTPRPLPADTSPAQPEGPYCGIPAHKV